MLLPPLNIKYNLAIIIFLGCSFSAIAQMEFIQNKGQWNKKVQYRSDFRAGSFFLENKGFTVLLHNPTDLQNVVENINGHQQNFANKTAPNDKLTLRSHAYNVTFLGAQNIVQNEPDKAIPTYHNYFIGSDEKLWGAGCKIYQAITYRSIYPNIDIRYYSEGEHLKYDFIVKPGGNPNAILMRYDGDVALFIKNNELVIGTTVGQIKELKPYTYQTGLKGQQPIETKFVVEDNVVSFKVSDYDKKENLIIDPTLIFSTFTGSSQENWGYTATPGADGTFYAGGVSFSNGFPVSPGAFSTSYNGGVPEGQFGGTDIAIMKYSANGANRMYATYLGGGANEQPHSMIVDASGNLIVAGRSNSANYPLKTGVSLAGGAYDIVVTKFNAAGTALIGSIKIGGGADDGVNIRAKYINPLGVDKLRRNYGDDARSEVILDGSDNVYLASCTQSSNFPTLLAAQAAFGGAQDGVILKFTPTLSTLLFSTYFGGASEDACFVASINPTNGNLYIGGASSSTNLLGNTANTIGTSNRGGIDGFVTILSQNGGPIITTTYLGTSGVDLVYGLKFDKVGFPYAMGTTTGNWPISTNVGYSVAGAKQFIVKMQPNLSAYVYSTTFGTQSTDPNISPVAFLVDRCENVYVSGWGGGINNSQNYNSGNTTNLPNVNPITGIPAPDGADFYFFVLRKDAQSQLFGSHFGQFGGLGDHVDGGTSRFDANGVIYQAICANCGGRTSTPPINFPTTPGVWARVNGSTSCNQASVKIDMNFAGIGSEIQSAIDGEINDSLGCIPLTVNFKDLRQKGVTYYWNFNSTANPAINDVTTTIPQTTFTFNNVGVYRVRLIAEDLSTCNLRDTSYITIRTGNDSVTPRFTRAKIGACTSTTYSFTNTSSTFANTAFAPNTFVWNYGDGSANDTSSFSPPRQHTFPGPGTYIITLKIFDNRFCNSPDSTSDTLRINDNVKAIPESGNLGCAPYTAIFKNKSLGGLSWQWQFYNATTNALLGTSTSFEPTFIFANIGTYKYRLIAFDATTCNLVDTSAFFNINVVQKPIAKYTWAPQPPEPNVPVRFTNLSQFADTYLWNFGDGETSTQVNPVHEFNATDTFNVTLIAFSRAGCSDTITLAVPVIVNPLLDVPNAFTPGRFGLNSVVNVRGFGIDKLSWKIYNRWGQLIFNSNNKKIGWDGTYKGKLQPIDTYTYSLEATFTDGKKLTKTGDITLLR